MSGNNFSESALVVPTIRTNSIKAFLEKWRGKGGWKHIVIIEDNDEKTISLQGLFEEPYPKIHHISHKEIQEDLKDPELYKIFSRRDSAIKCYGFYYAVKKLGVEFVVVLDDDCFPLEYKMPFDTLYHENMKFPIWRSSVRDFVPRGVPYKDTGTEEIHTPLHMGLWTENPDLDAVTELSNIRSNCEMKLSPPVTNEIIPQWQLFPFCGMNFAFESYLLPIMYFPKMGEGSPYSRFDDIWFGIMAKKILDLQRLPVSIGNPLVHHSKASNPFTNLIKESKGIKSNEIFWRIVDSFTPTDEGGDLHSLYLGLALHIKECTDDTYLINSNDEQGKEFLNYLLNLSNNMILWLKLCE